MAESTFITGLASRFSLTDAQRPRQRILFLESIAAVPGMVAAALRHLRSLRLMVKFLENQSLSLVH